MGDTVVLRWYLSALSGRNEDAMMPQFRARSYANSGYFNNGLAVTDGSIIPGLSR